MIVYCISDNRLRILLIKLKAFVNDQKEMLGWSALLAVLSMVLSSSCNIVALWEAAGTCLGPIQASCIAGFSWPPWQSSCSISNGNAQTANLTITLRKRFPIIWFDFIATKYTGHSYRIGAATTAAFLKLPAWLVNGPQIVSNGISRHTHPGYLVHQPHRSMSRSHSFICIRKQNFGGDAFVMGHTHSVYCGDETLLIVTFKPIGSRLIYCNGRSVESEELSNCV